MNSHFLKYTLSIHTYIPQELYLPWIAPAAENVFFRCLLCRPFSVDITNSYVTPKTFILFFWAHCNLNFEDDDDDDGSVNHQKSSHVDMTNDHLQDNNGQTKQVNHSIVWFLSPKKPLKDSDILFIWAWKTKTLFHCIVCFYKIIIQASFLNQKSIVCTYINNTFGDQRTLANFWLTKICPYSNKLPTWKKTKMFGRILVCDLLGKME